MLYKLRLVVTLENIRESTKVPPGWWMHNRGMSRKNQHTNKIIISDILI